MNDQTALAVVDGQPKPIKTPLMAGATPRAIVPIDFDGAYRIANVVVAAGMAPKTLNSVEKAMVAILHGLEVGLTPMNALQSIAVINGRPTIWGDGAIGLIRASGLLEYMQERFEGEGNALTAVCIVKRKGEPKEVRGEFSWSDVRRANLNNKEGPWQTYPRRMMQMRARWPLRDVFADVLKGLALKEEVEDMERQDVALPTQPQPPEQPARSRVPSPPPLEASTFNQVERAGQAEQSRERPSDGFPSNKPTAKPDPISSGKQENDSPGDKTFPEIPNILRREQPQQILTNAEERWLRDLRDTFAQCETVEELKAEQESIMLPSKATASRAAWKEAVAISTSNLKRIEG